MIRALIFLAAVSVASISPARAETILLMAEEHGCYWCARWNEDIGPIYPKTDMGKTAPLFRFDRRSEAPDVTLSSSVRFTPTFILAHNGQEVGRIEGYPGEEFFWGLLKSLFAQAEIAIDETGSSHDS